MLEDEEEGARLEKGGVLAMKLGFAEVRGFVGGWLCGRVSLNGYRCGGVLVSERSGYCCEESVVVCSLGMLEV